MHGVISMFDSDRFDSDKAERERLRDWLLTHLPGHGLPDHDVHYADIMETVVWDQRTGEVYIWQGRRVHIGSR